MREHQIVITLKPDQFLQVQRLARMAGAKSMGMFVRQRLLAALGIEGEPERQGGTVDLQPAVSELKRLHSELRGFVAESLAMYLDDSISSPGQEVTGDPDLMFGAGNPEVRTLPGIDPAVESVEDTHDLAEQESAEPLFETSPADDSDYDEPFGSDDDELLPPPAVANEAQSRTLGTVASIQNDELENLAERTFAISPRLGAIEPPAVPAPIIRPITPVNAQGQLRDPLSELLVGADLPDDASAGGDEEEDSFTVPLAIQERRRQIAEQQSQENIDSSLPDEQAQSRFTQDRPAEVSDQGLMNASGTQSETAKDPAKTEESSDSAVSDVSKSAPGASSLGNQGGSQLSGGPPPKRRKS